MSVGKRGAVLRANLKGGDRLKVSISKGKIIIEPLTSTELIVTQASNGDLIISKK